MNKKVSSEKVVQDIRRRTRNKYSSEEKIRIVLDGIRGEDSISNLCRREGIPANLYYRWSKDFLEGECVGYRNLEEKVRVTSQATDHIEKYRPSVSCVQF
jgi:transposase